MAARMIRIGEVGEMMIAGGLLIAPESGEHIADGVMAVQSYGMRFDGKDAVCRERLHQGQ